MTFEEFWKSNRDRYEKLTKLSVMLAVNTAAEEAWEFTKIDKRHGLATQGEWICEICGQPFMDEVDLLAHQFNSSCEKDIAKYRARRNDGK